MKVNFPKIGEKHDAVPLFSAKDFIAIRDKAKLSKMPKKVILVYSQRLYHLLRSKLGLKEYDTAYKSPFDSYLSLKPQIDDKNSVIVLSVSIGSPVTAIVAEELFSVGVEEIIILGAAGGIGKGIKLGEIVLCTKALRDEGTSHHYLKNSMYVGANGKLVSKLQKCIASKGIEFRKGPTWTTDAIYAETKKEIKEYGDRGILTVEMEASALFAVAAKKRAKAAAVFAVSDLLNGEEWTGLTKEEAFNTGVANLTEIADSFRTAPI